MSEKKMEIYAALLTAQKQWTGAIKDARNPHFKSDYSSLPSVLDAVKEPLNAVGVVIAQPVEYHHEQWCICTRLTHTDSGTSIESMIPIVSKDMNDPQKWGSAITYARRYTLQSLVGLPALDDDGNGAATPETKRGNKQPAQRQEDEQPPPDNSGASHQTELAAAKGELWRVAKEKGIALDALGEFAKQQTGKPLADLEVKEIETLTAKIIIGDVTKG